MFRAIFGSVVLAVASGRRNTSKAAGGHFGDCVALLIDTRVYRQQFIDFPLTDQMNSSNLSRKVGM